MAYFIGGAAGAAVAGGLASVVGGKLLSGGSRGGGSSVSDAASAMQAEIAADQWNRYKEIYEPLERGLVDDAQGFDSLENYSRAAGEASATVASQFGKARDRLTRTPGLDPSSAGYQSSMVGLNLAQAAADATQQNAARTGVRDMAYARKKDALGLGKGLATDAVTGMAGVSRQRMAQDQFNTQQNNLAAQALGQVTNRVLTSKPVSDWLGNVGKTPASTTNSPGGSGWGMDLGFDN